MKKRPTNKAKSPKIVVSPEFKTVPISATTLVIMAVVLAESIFVFFIYWLRPFFLAIQLFTSAYILLH